MKKKLIYSMFLSTIMLSACQANQGAIPDIINKDHKENQIVQLHNEENQPEVKLSEYNDHQNEVPDSEDLSSHDTEKTVTVGVSGFEEDVTLVKFSNEWVSLWYDPSLEVEENQDDIRFLAQSNEVTFRVERIDNEWESSISKEAIVNEYNGKGYKLINQFRLDYREGWGYIFYSYEKRHSLDVYFLDGAHDSIKIEFIVPDDKMDKYIMRFEYMLETVEIIS